MKVYNFESDLNLTPENSDEQYMREALKLAEQAFRENEVPIGAIIVANGKIIGKGYNLTERLNDVTAHAEMQAFTAAANFLGGKYLKDCTLYVTIEPCVMCAGASYWTQISRIVYGARDEKRGYSAIGDKIIHPKTEIKAGVLEEDCANLVKSFFRNKR
ncbi:MULTISPECIES: nucleoside deaminase [unclassified Sphingobacterium]|uniref:nucleoside deaminase n=1 Tax=unclassified Sphingobacterium TaxID=2609468 RepID=UPI00265C9D53|nr:MULTISPECIES: nucleoside deaminase [unclassified Sphingobacterium]WKK57960.1 nucleoside deaminase [Sphingobacterium sp. BN32]